MANRHRAAWDQSSNGGTYTAASLASWASTALSTRTMVYTSGETMTSSLGTAFWPARKECVLCETAIPEDRQKEHKSHCSAACENAAAVAQRLAGPKETYAEIYQYGIGSTIPLSSFASTVSGYSWRLMSTAVMNVSGAFPVTLGKP